MSSANPTPSGDTNSGVDKQHKRDWIKELGEEELARNRKIAKHMLESAIARLSILKPLYGLVFIYISKIQTETMPTMAVGVIKRTEIGLFFNPHFVMSLTPDELRAVLMHEALHLLLHHITRRAHFGYQHKAFNIAADMAINCNLKNLPENCFLPSTFKFEDFKSSEFYYEMMRRMANENKSGEGMAMFDPEGSAGGKGELVDDHDCWGGDGADGQGIDEEIVKEKIRGIADKAIDEQMKQKGAGCGDIPGHLLQEIIAANKPQVNWKKELRYFINKIVYAGTCATRTRLNRREQALSAEKPESFQDIYLYPGKKKEFKSRILVGIDTSGSVSDGELREFVSELNGMISHVIVDYICFDHIVQFKEPIPFDKKASSIQIKGRGGTCFEPIVKMADDLHYDGLIIMTDGGAPFPPKPKCRVFWALSHQGESIFPPYGKRAVIKVKNRS